MRKHMSSQSRLLDACISGADLFKRDAFDYIALYFGKLRMYANRTGATRLAAHFFFRGAFDSTRGAHKERSASRADSPPDTSGFAGFGRFLRAGFSVSACSAFVIFFLGIMLPPSRFSLPVGLHRQGYAFSWHACHRDIHRLRRCLLATPGAMTELK
jgi:hypothetical protein